ncbi:phage holin family protein [Flaviflexus huanghaiensis]|uniref:phage holin family protein n=1 Tax=Flaviflexus huanghaiensis TaxID=1111473 RepID=UPI0015FC20B2|nr:phage holin family protein [Flaviflexus huanghaiensis]
MKFIVRTLVAALALWLTSLLLPGIEAPQAQSDTQFVLYLIGIGAIFTLVSLIIRPIIVVLSIPLYILTLGLWALVVNAIILLFSSWIANQFGWGMMVDGFWWAVAGGFVIAVIIMIIDAILPESLRR